MKTPIRLLILLALAAPFSANAQEKKKPEGFSKDKLAEILQEEARQNKGQLMMDLDSIKERLLKAGMPQAELDKMSRQDLLKFLMESMGGTGSPFDALPKAADIPDDPDFDRKKFAELLMKEAENGKGQLELNLDKFKDWMIQAGMKKDKVEKMSPPDVFGFLMKNLAGMGLPGLGGLGMGFDEESVKQLDEQFEALLEGHRPAIKESWKSTVIFFKDQVPLTLGTVIDARGLVVSKLSEVKKGGKALQCRLDEKTRVDAQIVKEWKDQNLALVRIDAKDLKPITWYGGELPDIGAFLTAPGPGTDQPLGIGLLSVEARSLTHKNMGFLGIGVGSADMGVKVTTVFEKSPAAEAGLEPEDVIVSLNGKRPESVPDFIQEVGSHQPKQKVKLKVNRGEEKKDFEIELTERPRDPRGASPRMEQMGRMGGAISDVRNGFPMAFQHDIPLEPLLMGGPVVDLQGRVLGMNIARSSRIKTYALPAREIRSLVKPVNLEQFLAPAPTPPVVAQPKPVDELAGLRKEVKRALMEVENARKALDRAEKAARAAADALKALE